MYIHIKTYLFSQITVEPSDGSGLRSEPPPACGQRLYQFSVRENVPPRSRVGTVETPGVKNAQFSIYPPTDERYFYMSFPLLSIYKSVTLSIYLTNYLSIYKLSIFLVSPSGLPTA